MHLQLLSNGDLTERLRTLSQRDLKLTAEIDSHIHEFMARRLYLEHGSTSMFGYLVDKLSYPRATAQNRIDAARLLGDVPEIGDDLANGRIGLGQITWLSAGIRQAEKETPGLKISAVQKRDLVTKLKATKLAAVKSENSIEATSARMVAAERLKAEFKLRLLRMKSSDLEQELAIWFEFERLDRRDHRYRHLSFAFSNVSSFGSMFDCRPG